MLWQDFVFLAGSLLSIVFLAPTLRDTEARVPLATSMPLMIIGLVYGTTFTTLGMAFSAAGSFAVGTMWSLIALFRSPSLSLGTLTLNRTKRLTLFAGGARRWGSRRFTTRHAHDRYPPNE